MAVASTDICGVKESLWDLCIGLEVRLSVFLSFIHKHCSCFHYIFIYLDFTSLSVCVYVQFVCVGV